MRRQARYWAAVQYVQSQADRKS